MTAPGLDRNHHHHRTVSHLDPGSTLAASSRAAPKPERQVHPGKPAATIKYSHESNVRLTIT